jgi:hypothetical protein
VADGQQGSMVTPHGAQKERERGFCCAGSGSDRASGGAVTGQDSAVLFLATHPRGSTAIEKDQHVSTVSDATESGPLDYFAPDSQASHRLLPTQVRSRASSPLHRLQVGSPLLPATEGGGCGISYLV